MRILVIEDDRSLLGFIGEAMAAQGYSVVRAEDGAQGLRLATDGDFDAAIIDRMLPGFDGLAIVRALRSVRKETPILLLTALGAVRERVEGLEAGADDYLTKPFSMPELLARTAALVRRPSLGWVQTRFAIGDLFIDAMARTARLGDMPLPLQPREFELLACLSRHAGRVVTRAMLLEQVWQLTFDPRTNIVESHISRLRGKLDRLGRKVIIETIRGEGYMLRAA